MTDDDRPRLFVESGHHEGEISLLQEGTTYIGRSSKCGLVLNKTSGVSRQHAQIVYRLGTYSIMDLDSRNGTFVNGEEVIGRYPLNDNDRIEISEEKIVFHGPSGRAVTRTSARRRAILEKAPVLAPPVTPPITPPMPPPDAAPVGEVAPGELRSASRTDEFIMKDITNPKGPPPVPHLPAPALKERSAALPNRRHAPPAPPVTVGNQEITHDRPVVVLAQKSSPLKWILLLLALPILAFCIFDFGLNDAKITKSLFSSSDAPLVAMQAEKEPGENPTIDKVAADKVAADKVAADKVADDKVAADKVAADKVAADKVAADKVTDDKVAADKVADDKVAADKVAADKVAADKVAADKVAADKVAADKVAADKVAANKVAADKVAAGAGSVENAIAPLTGVLTLKVRKGSSVRAGQSIGSVRGSIQSPISDRKLRTLKREERSFARAGDNERAKRELRAIRKEIAKLEARANVTRTLRSPIDGVVTRLNSASGKSVRKGAPILEVRSQ